MDVKSSKQLLKKIKNFLVFFCVFPVLIGCTDYGDSTSPILEYENNRAIRVAFKTKASQNEFSVYRLNDPHVPILGSFSENEGYVSFTPVIPFSKDQEFGIAHKGKQIAKFKVKKTLSKQVPRLVAIYPRQDTVPANLLRMYLEFSEPMHHVAQPLDFITVYDKTEEQEISPFLQMEAELWNMDHTRVTLWLDPGRIKTNLIPNKERGLPLKENHSYEITIDKSWKSAVGVSLLETYFKTIHVVGRDLRRPNPKQWKLEAPKNGTKSPLRIDLNEDVDLLLATESLKVVKGDVSLPGKFKLSDNKQRIVFEPDNFWEAGEYRLHVNPILEDLAGNNLKHLFDIDLKETEVKNKINTILEFSVQ